MQLECCVRRLRISVDWHLSALAAGHLSTKKHATLELTLSRQSGKRLLVDEWVVYSPRKEEKTCILCAINMAEMSTLHDQTPCLHAALEVGVVHHKRSVYSIDNA
jgi:hypothetical protein